MATPSPKKASELDTSEPETGPNPPMEDVSEADQCSEQKSDQPSAGRRARDGARARVQEIRGETTSYLQRLRADRLARKRGEEPHGEEPAPSGAGSAEPSARLAPGGSGVNLDAQTDHGAPHADHGPPETLETVDGARAARTGGLPHRPVRRLVHWQPAPRTPSGLPNPEDAEARRREAAERRTQVRTLLARRALGLADDERGEAAPTRPRRGSAAQSQSTAQARSALPDAAPQSEDHSVFERLLKGEAAGPRPDERDPVEAGPVEPSPVEPRPVEPSPVEASPVEASPVGAGPGDPSSGDATELAPAGECDVDLQSAPPSGAPGVETQAAEQAGKPAMDRPAASSTSGVWVNRDAFDTPLDPAPDASPASGGGETPDAPSEPVDLREALKQRKIRTPVPIDALPMIGTGMRVRLNQIGVRTVQDLAAADPVALKASLGEVSRLAHVEAWIDAASVFLHGSSGPAAAQD